MHSAVQWITHYGYAGIFSLLALGIVGLPIPDETLLVFVGFLIFRGKLHTVPAFVSAFSGAVCGITLSYGLGRGFGTYLVPRWGRFLRLSRERLERVQDWFRRSGRWVLVFGYYVPGVRHLTAYVAGASGLPFRAFAVFAYAGGLVWSLTFYRLRVFPRGRMARRDNSARTRSSHHCGNCCCGNPALSVAPEGQGARCQLEKIVFFVLPKAFSAMR
jgi:membrane protein DedA with SNARE-associated domain